MKKGVKILVSPDKLKRYTPKEYKAIKNNNEDAYYQNINTSTIPKLSNVLLTKSHQTMLMTMTSLSNIAFYHQKEREHTTVVLKNKPETGQLVVQILILIEPEPGQPIVRRQLVGRQLMLRQLMSMQQRKRKSTSYTTVIALKCSRSKIGLEIKYNPIIRIPSQMES